MKALTICQPYASMIASGEKRVENRNWSTAYRGPLAIHAGKSRKWLNPSELTDEMVFGAVIATCDLVACIHISQVQAGSNAERFPWLSEHSHAFGPFCWVLVNVTEMAPAYCRGKLGLWDWQKPTNRGVFNRESLA